MQDSELMDLRSSTGTPVNGPVVVDDVDAAPWDESCDVLVVGLGLAGASATMRASELGQDVIAIDRFMGGGASEMSGGIVYAGGTHVQHELGVDDTPENMFDYLQQETGNLIPHDALRQFCDDSPALIRWLEKFGIKFGGPIAPRKTSYPMAGDFLYVSGNELVPSYVEKAKSAPRGHRAMPTYKSNHPYGGQFIMHSMKAAMASARGVRTMFHTAARRLIVDKEGAVVGAEIWRIPPETPEAKKHAKLYARGNSITLGLLGMIPSIWAKTAELERKYAKPVRVRARSGVVLSAGGFANNRDMVQKTAPAYMPVMPLGTMADDGSGIQLGVSVGAACGKLDHISTWRFINPPYAWVRGIIVGPNGERFDNEELYGARLGKDMCERGGGKAYLIVDAAMQKLAISEVKQGGMLSYQKYPVIFSMYTAPKAKTIAELAAKAGIGAGRLEAEVEAYNQSIREGAPDATGKSNGNRALLANPPYYAVDLSCGQKFSPVMGLSMGGLDVDQNSGAVRKSDGSLIAGLYAAGRTAVGIPSNNYISGLSLADCAWSGKRAAESIAART